jgi:hypothetical protein
MTLVSLISMMLKTAGQLVLDLVLQANVHLEENVIHLLEACMLMHPILVVVNQIKFLLLFTKRQVIPIFGISGPLEEQLRDLMRVDF